VLQARTDSGPRPAGVLAAVVVMATAAALIVWKVGVAVKVGPGWDTYAFLSNAAEFAGKGFGYTEPHRPPALPLLVSFVFRVVGLRQDAIQWVDGALTLSGIAAVYVLMRRRFDPVFSAAGALALLAVTPLWTYLGVGYTDTAAIALCTWLLIVVIKATEDNPVWFLAAGPLFVSAMMMRFTAILFAFACLVWLGFRASFFRHARVIAFSALLGLLVYSPAAAYYQRRFGDVMFPFLVAFGFSEAVTVPGGEGATNSALYYLTRTPVFLGPAPLAVLTVFVLLVAFAALLTTLGGYFERTRPGLKRFGFAALCLLPAILAQLGGGLVLRQLTIPFSVFALWRIFAERDDRKRTIASSALDATMVAWLATYVDFHGHQGVLVPRYFITMAVPLIYLLIRGWELAASRLSAAAVAQDDRTGRSALVHGAVTAFLLLTIAAGLVTTVATTPLTPDKLVASAADTAAWLATQPGVRDEVVYSDLWPLTAWYLRDNVRPMPSYEATPAYSHELDKADARYFVTIRARRYDEYAEAFRAPTAVVLERSEDPTATLPRIQYLGKAWDNYLEQLTGFDFYLMSTAGRYGWEGSSYLDAFPASELAAGDAVAIYGVKWRSRAQGERALRSYVENGGAVVLDASQNLDGLTYSMADTVAFDAVVRRDTLPPDAQLSVDPAFSRKHGLDPMITSAFVDEGGGVWAGASYVERPGTPPLRTLVSAGGKPVVSVRDVGKGRVYFIGYNLPWHAFSKRNDSEAALIRAVFADAVQHTRANQEAP